MTRSGVVVKTAAIIVTFALILGAAGGLYYYTLPPGASNASGGKGASNGITVKQLDFGQAGRQNLTSTFNGTSYTFPAKYANAPSPGCPTGTDPNLCTILTQSCGNGGVEPWENCYNCSFDAGCTGINTCDPYTHACAAAVSACQVAVYGGG